MGRLCVFSLLAAFLSALAADLAVDLSPPPGTCTLVWRHEAHGALSELDQLDPLCGVDLTACEGSFATLDASYNTLRRDQSILEFDDRACGGIQVDVQRSDWAECINGGCSTPEAVWHTTTGCKADGTDRVYGVACNNMEMDSGEVEQVALAIPTAGDQVYDFRLRPGECRWMQIFTETAGEDEGVDTRHPDCGIDFRNCYVEMVRSHVQGQNCHGDLWCDGIKIHVDVQRRDDSCQESDTPASQCPELQQHDWTERQECAFDDKGVGPVGFVIAGRCYDAALDGPERPELTGTSSCLATGGQAISGLETGVTGDAPTPDAGGAPAALSISLACCTALILLMCI